MAYKRNKKAKSLYDKLRYRKKKIINTIETMQKKLKNIYDNQNSFKLANYTKKEIEEIYKQAVFNKDKEQIKKLLELGKEIKGGEKEILKKWTESIQKDLSVNIYGTRPSTLRAATKRDKENFDTLMKNLTPEQKAEFLNSTTYYGARRYQKPPAESETFNLQVEQDGASYIVQDLIRFYKDKGLTIPTLKQTSKRKR